MASFLNNVLTAHFALVFVAMPFQATEHGRQEGSCGSSGSLLVWYV